MVGTIKVSTLEMRKLRFLIKLFIKVTRLVSENRNFESKILSTQAGINTIDSEAK